MKLAIVSLGCPKNQVDADVFCRALLEEGHETVAEMALADAVLINTCGFIQSAKEEAIEMIFDAVALKKQNPALRILVTGCLAERYRDEVAKEIPEVDAVVGIGKNADLPAILRALEAEGPGEPKLYFGEKTNLVAGGPRVIGTPGHYAYLKIAEGCSNACAYCAIPLIRGPMRSRPLAGCVEEARWLAGQGVRELLLVAQDVTAYGEDGGENLLPRLLRELDGIEGLRWIRLLYAYPERITPALLETMAQSRRVLPYIDMPVQHIDDEILRSMRRKGDSRTIRSALRLVREILPGATLRTSLIAGYPGESEAQFEALCNFVAEAKFDRLGCFAYSPEEGTPAAALPGQLNEEEKQRRAGVVMELQHRILAQKQQALVGTSRPVLCDEVDAAENTLVCRTAADAPEIDTLVFAPPRPGIGPGDFLTAHITGTDGMDLYATVAPEEDVS